MNLSSLDQFKKFADNVFALSGNISSEGVLLEIDGDLLELTEFDKDSLVGRDFLESIVWQTDDTNISKIKSAFDRATKGEISKESLDFRVNSKERKHIDINFVPNLDDVSNEIFFCITDVKDLHGEINEFKGRCDHFLYAADIGEVGLWFWNLETDDIYSTPKCNDIYGLEKDEKISYEYILSIVHPDDFEKVESNIFDARTNKTEYSIQFRVIYSDGNMNWVWAHGRTVENNAAAGRTMVGSVRIINDSKTASEELERIYNLETKAKFEAEKANKTKDFFLALVSHEMRSPLNAILGWTNILLKKEVDAATTIKALETIERSAKTQSKLIEDLVDSARVTSGKLKLELRPLNLYEILLNVYNSHIPSMDDKKINREFSVQSENIEIIGDTMRLRQVFSNLIGNAIKFTSENEQISIKQISDNDNVTIVFKDTGQGIDEDDLPLIFNRFAQGDENYASGKGGLGLGLALAKILVEHHNGTIDVQSEGIGFGSTFTIVLPITAEDSAASLQPEEVTETKSESINRILNGKIILIVEDDEDSRNVLELYLDQIGAKIHSADSVKAAFNLLDELGSVLPDLIISDIGMPDEDGYSFVKKIRNSDKYKKIPAIALSAFTASDNIRKAFESGFQKYHTKPFEPDLLVDEIVELLNPPKKKAS